MNPSILIPYPSSSRTSVLFSPFINPIPHRLTRTNPCNSLTRKRLLRYRMSTVRCFLRSSSDQPPTNFVPSDVFGGNKELTGIESLVDAVSPPVRLVRSVIVFAGAVASGYALGFCFGGSRNAGLGGALALGAAGAGAAYALNSCVPEVAAVNLHNYAAGCDDPVAMKEDIENIAKKYGVNKQIEAFNSELCDLYCRFVSAILPLGSEDLKGHEVETIIQF